MGNTHATQRLSTSTVALAWMGLNLPRVRFLTLPELVVWNLEDKRRERMGNSFVFVLINLYKIDNMRSYYSCTLRA